MKGMLGRITDRRVRRVALALILAAALLTTTAISALALDPGAQPPEAEHGASGEEQPDGKVQEHGSDNQHPDDVPGEVSGEEGQSPDTPDEEGSKEEPSDLSLDKDGHGEPETEQPEEGLMEPAHRAGIWMHNVTIARGDRAFDLLDGVWARDIENNQIEVVEVADRGGFDPNQPGDYQVVYFAEDPINGTEYSASRTVTVEEAEVPDTEPAGARIAVSTYEELAAAFAQAGEDLTIELLNDIELETGIGLGGQAPMLDLLDNLTGSRITLTIDGGKGGSVITASRGKRHMRLNGINLILINVTLDGEGTGGGIELQDGSLHLTEGSSIRRCVAERGGAVEMLHAQSSLYLYPGSALADNRAELDGGAVYDAGGGVLVFEQAQITGNAAGQSGGGIYLTGNLTAQDCTFEGNEAGQSGGAVYNAGRMTAPSAVFACNEAGVQGGAIYTTDYFRTELDGASFSRNSAAYLVPDEEIQPEDRELHDRFIQRTAALSPADSEYAYNNYDVNYLNIVRHRILAGEHSIEVIDRRPDQAQPAPEFEELLKGLGPEGEHSLPVVWDRHENIAVEAEDIRFRSDDLDEQVDFHRTGSYRITLAAEWTDPATGEPLTAQGEATIHVVDTTRPEIEVLYSIINLPAGDIPASAADLLERAGVRVEDNCDEAVAATATFLAASFDEIEWTRRDTEYVMYVDAADANGNQANPRAVVVIRTARSGGSSVSTGKGNGGSYNQSGGSGGNTTPVAFSDGDASVPVTVQPGSDGLASGGGSVSSGTVTTAGSRNGAGNGGEPEHSGSGASTGSGSWVEIPEEAIPLTLPATGAAGGGCTPPLSMPDALPASFTQRLRRCTDRH